MAAQAMVEGGLAVRSGWLDVVMSIISPVFAQSRSRMAALDYVAALLHAEGRRSCWQLAELAFSYDELTAREEANLDITWLRDESLEHINKSPPRRHTALPATRCRGSAASDTTLGAATSVQCLPCINHAGVPAAMESADVVLQQPTWRNHR